MVENDYRVTFLRDQIADYDITFIRDVVARHFGVDHVTFNQAFQQTDVSFYKKMPVDDAQLCLTELEAAGINAQVEKLPISAPLTDAVSSRVSASAEPLESTPSAEPKDKGGSLDDAFPKPIIPRILRSFLPNRANSAVVVFSYLIVVYQLVSLLG